MAVYREKRPYTYPHKLLCSWAFDKEGCYLDTSWFKIRDADFKALLKALSKTKFCNDIMKKVYQIMHTGKLERFYSMKLQYLPKSKGLRMSTSVCVTMMPVL